MRNGNHLDREEMVHQRHLNEGHLLLALYGEYSMIAYILNRVRNRGLFDGGTVQLFVEDLVKINWKFRG